MRARRHVGPSALDSMRSIRWRRFLYEVGLIVAVALLGFGLSSSWINPGPIIESDHAVPRVLELPEAEARQALTEAGFRPRIVDERPSVLVPRGAVVLQDPPPDMVLPPNTLVDLVVSGGPAPVTVPDVVGLAQPFAERIMVAAGIKVGKVDTVPAAGEPGVVLATRPPPGHGRPPGSRIDLVVSGGPVAGAAP